MSSTGDLNFCSVLTMLCGTSSRFVQVIAVPAATAVVAGAKLKLSTTTSLRTGRHRRLPRGHIGDRDRMIDVVERHPRKAEHLLQAVGRRLSSGPGDGAVPGAGCGNAVDIAV